MQGWKLSICPYKQTDHYDIFPYAFPQVTERKRMKQHMHRGYMSN